MFMEYCNTLYYYFILSDSVYKIYMHYIHINNKYVKYVTGQQLPYCVLKYITYILAVTTQYLSFRLSQFQFFFS